MFTKFPARIRFFLMPMVIGLVTLLLLSGCNGREKVAVTGLMPLSKDTKPPIEVNVGSEPVSMRAEASGTGVSLTYEWGTLEEECGQFEIIDDTEPVARYHPPDRLQTSGKPQVCTLKVEGFLDGKTVGTAYLEVKVVPKTVAVNLAPPAPTDTPTPTLTDTSTPTAPSTLTPTPIETATKTPTPTPTSTEAAAKTPTPTNTPGTTEALTVTITITEPKKEVECPRGAACTFTINGTSTGIAPNSAYKIVPFVNPWPDDPEQWWPQWERPLGSEINQDGAWQAEARIGTDQGVVPGHRFGIVALVLDAETETPLDFQSLPASIAKSNVVILVTTAKPPACQSFRPSLVGAADFAGEVEILTPSNCTTGLQTETPTLVAGNYEGIPDNVDIWVLVYPPNMVYYPQSPNACEGEPPAQGGGKWQVPVYLGGKGGPPEWFDIVVVLADQEASQFFSDWGRQGCQTGDWIGIPSSQLEPMNVTEMTYITVQTLD